jgi:glycosyltransferase involved in cell wall biosynthesis
MRILMASDLFHPYTIGGGERQMYEIAKRLAKRHEIHVITRKLGKSANYERHQGVHIHRVNVPSKGIALESPLNGLFFMIGAFFKSMRLGEFDVYAPQQFFPIPPIWLTSKIRGKPIVTTIHDVYRDVWLKKYGVKSYLMVLFERMMLKLPSAGVITVSNSTKKKLLESGVPENVIKIIPNGVNIDEYDRLEVRKSNKPRIIYLGRLFWSKNIDDLIIAFSKLDFDAELFIVGDGPERENLENLVKKLKMDNKVFLTGFIDDKRTIELLKSSWVLVLPSSTEGFGIAVIEAWASRTAVIVSDILALRELVKDMETGLTFKLRDVGELKKRLDQMLRDKKLRERVSEGGYKLVKEKFSWDKVTAEVEKSFLNVE